MQNKINIQPKIENNHTITLENQSKARITGVYEVVTATEKGVFCKLSSNNLQIGGDNLRIAKLLPEEKLLILDGHILEIKYYATNTKTNLFKKLFR